MSFVSAYDTDGVRVLTLDRPETLNALTLEGMRELGERVEAAAADPAVRALVLTGAGKAFSAGGDAQFLLGIPAMTDAELRTVVYGTFQRPVRAIRAMPKPVVAAVNGPAVGAGCELAVASDFRLASEHARFGEVWIRLGCVPALGGMYLLPRIVGLTRATEMILTGELVDAAEAHRIGLVTRVVPASDAAVGLARALALGPAKALAAAKAAINRGLASDLWTGLDATVADQLGCFRTADFAEGVR
ncbi:MAG: enoyl-CoA hydratase/isomerase family protein, partial [Candidatus Rokubacteria bacterium]|nr:enoyl-CoA hydratase/isomerase family protein [Candidatus Rokubacteria bacterium]